MREKIPSCILAPPEAVKITTGNWRLIPSWKAFVIFSPTTCPIDPIMKNEFMTQQIKDSSPIVATPTVTASFSLATFEAFSNFASYPGKATSTFGFSSSKSSWKVSTVMANRSAALILK